MKPDWKDAPEWANWLALDIEGWQWFSVVPEFNIVDGWIDGGRWEYAGMSSGDVSFSAALEARPIETYHSRP